MAASAGLRLRPLNAQVEEESARGVKGRMAGVFAPAPSKPAEGRENQASAGFVPPQRVCRKGPAAGTSDAKKKAARISAMAAEAATGAEGENLTRLSKDIVDYILAWKPMAARDPDEYYATMTKDPLQCFPQDYIDRNTAILRDIAEVTERTNASFNKFQDWARAELEEKGYVEVDDIYIAQRILFCRAMAEQEPSDMAELEAIVAEVNEEDGPADGSAVENQRK